MLTTLIDVLVNPLLEAAGVITPKRLVHTRIHRKGYDVSQQLSKPSVLPVAPDSFPKIKLFFDGVDYVIERATHSVLNSKILLLVLLGLFILACELIRFAIFILKGHSGPN